MIAFFKLCTLIVLRAYSSVGRAPVLHTGGHRFESFCAQGILVFAGVVQLVRALPCHGRSCGFEPRLPRSFYSITIQIAHFLYNQLLIAIL